MTTPGTEAGFDLERLQTLSDILYKRGSFAISAELNEMIALARQAAPDTTASASIYVRQATLDHISASSFVKHEITVRTEPNDGWVPLAAQPVQAGEAVDERVIFNVLYEMRLAPRHQLEEAAKRIASLAPVSAQQGAARQDAVECISALRAEPASQHEAGAKVLTDDEMLVIADENDYAEEDPKCIVRLCRAVEAAVVARCRAEGGNTSDNKGSDLAAKASAAQAMAKSNHAIADRLSLWLSSSMDDHLRQDDYRKHIRAWLDFDNNGTALASPASTPEAATEQQQDHVMPPTRGTESQLNAEIEAKQAQLLREDLRTLQSFVNDLDDGSASRAFYNVRASIIAQLHAGELARRCRVQGGNTKDSSANLATPTAGAAETSEDARDAARLEAWSYSKDEERYHEQEPSRIAIIQHALGELDDDASGFWIGRNVRFTGKGDAGSIIEALQEQAYDECGEFAETYLEDVTAAEEAELEALVTGWAKRVDRSNFWTVKDVEYISVEQAREAIAAMSSHQAKKPEGA